MVAERAERAEVHPGDGRIVSLAQASYSRVPNAVYDDETLTIYERAVYGLLLRRDWQGRGWAVTHAQLARAAGCCVSHVQRSLRTLQARGWVRKECRPGRECTYFARLRVPSGHTEASVHHTEASVHHTEASVHHTDPSLLTTLNDKNDRNDGDGVGVAGAGAHEAPPPPLRTSEPQSEGLVRTWLGCNGQSVEKAHPQTLARYRAWADAVLARGYTADDVVGCLGYTAQRQRAAGKTYLLTDAILADRLEPWIAAGRPERSTHGAGAEKSGTPHGAEVVGVRAQPDAPVNWRLPGQPAVICACGAPEWKRHVPPCRLGGPVRIDHWIPPGQEWRRPAIQTPAAPS